MTAPDLESFGLAHMDLNKQNVIFDDSGNVIGILDWQWVRTAPSFMSWAGLPIWLRADFSDPCYMWPLVDEDICPEQLAQYRELYAAAVWEVTGDAKDWLIVRGSAAAAACNDALFGGNKESVWVRKILAKAIPGVEMGSFVEILGQRGWQDDKEMEAVGARLHGVFDGKLKRARKTVWQQTADVGKKGREAPGPRYIEVLHPCP